MIQDYSEEDVARIVSYSCDSGLFRGRRRKDRQLQLRFRTIQRRTSQGSSATVAIQDYSEEGVARIVSYSCDSGLFRGGRRKDHQLQLRFKTIQRRTSKGSSATVAIQDYSEEDVERIVSYSCDSGVFRGGRRKDRQLQLRFRTIQRRTSQGSSATVAIQDYSEEDVARIVSYSCDSRLFRGGRRKDRQLQLRFRTIQRRTSQGSSATVAIQDYSEEDVARIVSYSCDSGVFRGGRRKDRQLQLRFRTIQRRTSQGSSATVAIQDYSGEDVERIVSYGCDSGLFRGGSRKDRQLRLRFRTIQGRTSQGSSATVAIQDYSEEDVERIVSYSCDSGVFRGGRRKDRQLQLGFRTIQRRTSQGSSATIVIQDYSEEDVARIVSYNCDSGLFRGGRHKDRQLQLRFRGIQRRTSQGSSATVAIQDYSEEDVARIVSYNCDSGLFRGGRRKDRQLRLRFRTIQGRTSQGSSATVAIQDYSEEDIARIVSYGCDSGLFRGGRRKDRQLRLRFSTIQRRTSQGSSATVAIQDYSEEDVARIVSYSCDSGLFRGGRRKDRQLQL